MVGRRSVVAFAVFASLLLATTPTAVSAQSAELVVGSQHSTATEFQNAQRLENVTVDNGQVILGTGTGADIPPYPETQGISDRRGLEIVPQADTNSITARLSPLASGITTVYLTDSSGAVIDTAAVNGGDVVTLQASLSAETTYYVLADANGASYTLPINTSPSYPYSGPNLNVTAGIYNDGDSRSTSYAYIFSSIASGLTEAERGVYVSSNHSVTNASQAKINITAADNVTVYGTVQEYTSGSWSDVASGSWTTTGNKTLDISAATSSTLRVNVSFVKTGSNPDGAFGDESILFFDHPPQVTLEAPADGSELQESTVTLKADITDPEFGTAQGDTVTVEFQTREPGAANWTTAATASTSTNGTVSANITADIGGTWDWRVHARDAYGLTTTSDTFTFKVPATLFVRNEQNATQLVDENVNVTVQFITEGGEVVTRTTSGGTISLNGLPVADRFVVSADAENWTARRTVITSIYEQNSIYLLRDTASTVTVTFDLQDDTGNFPPSETTLYIQTALDPDGDGNSEYVTVSADTFGATGTYSATLVQDERYRLMVTNQDGDTRVLGSYIPRASGTEPLPIGQISLQGDVVNGTAFGAALRNVSGERVIRIQYRDPSLTTTELYVYVYQAGNESNVLRENTSVAGPFGTYTETVVIPDGAPTNRTYVVEYTAVRDGSPNVHGSERVGAVSEWSGLGIDPQLLEIIAMTGIVAFAGLGVIIDGSLGATAATVMAFLVTVVGAVYIHPLLLMLAAVEALLFLVGRQY